MFLYSNSFESGADENILGPIMLAIFFFEPRTLGWGCKLERVNRCMAYGKQKRSIIARKTSAKNQPSKTPLLAHVLKVPRKLHRLVLSQDGCNKWRLIVFIRTSKTLFELQNRTSKVLFVTCIKSSIFLNGQYAAFLGDYWSILLAIISGSVGRLTLYQ